MFLDLQNTTNSLSNIWKSFSGLLKVASSRLSRLNSSTFKDFQTVYEGEIWCLCTVNFGPKSSKLNSRPVYCSGLYGMCKKLKSHNGFLNYLQDSTANSAHPAALFLPCLGWPSKSHHENSISCMILQSSHQVSVKNIVKCWEDFFGIPSLWMPAKIKRIKILTVVFVSAGSSEQRGEGLLPPPLRFWQIW